MQKVTLVHPADYVASFERLLNSLPTCIFADEDDPVGDGDPVTKAVSLWAAHVVREKL
jgi:hypothetical protein